MFYFKRFLAIFLWLIIIGTIGCGRTQATKFYILSPIEYQDAKAHSVKFESNSKIAIGVGPITLPNYLDRPQIITGVSQSQLSLADFHHWAEPLQHNMGRVLSENLSGLIPTNRIAVYPWRHFRADYQIEIDVVRMYSDAYGKISLIATWRIIKNDNGKLISLNKSNLNVSVDAGDFDQIVNGHSRLLADLSREIAVAINNFVEIDD